MSEIIFYLHLLFATIWIGGMITLIGFIIYSKSKKTSLFYEFTTYYGWLNIFVLTFLIITGIILVYQKGLYYLLLQESEISTLLWIKIILVFFGIIATFIHSYIILHVRQRTRTLNIMSKISSFYLFFSSFFILYLAIKIHDLV